MDSISIIGTGYVGLVTGACLSEFGMKVICMDTDKLKIEALNRGEIPIYEPGLASLVAKNRSAGRLVFTSDPRKAVQRSGVIFIAVGTPIGEDGSADLKHVLSAAASIADRMDDYKVIVTKSTVPVGTSRMVKKIIQEALQRRELQLEFDIVSNPEFLREGSAIRDFMHPDRIVIGSENERAKNIIRDIYNVLYLIDTPFVFTSLETAELIKYASNGFLATKITFINEIANLCEAVGADVHDVAKAMGMDGRIGKYFLHPGPGFGGSCLPKDTKALVKIGLECNSPVSLVDSAIKANEFQKRRMVGKIERKIGDLKDKVIGVLGLAFKQGTDDMREAVSIPIILELIEKGSRVKTYDPAAMANANKYAFAGFNITYCEDEYEAADGADALVILTEWNQFRHLDLERIKSIMKGRFFFDFRNIYEPGELTTLGFIYEGVGR
ncbi:MAG: UDP-glucose/GDP-mannose dehydrogenase family protein [Candidatus Aminicenantes bacterium]|nr:UDP-glucose/GDP-mannose dehydrogenase family protein [Candidatus Aminicenantes bacterium]